MLYEEYEKYKSKYYEAQKKFDEILSEKEKLFIKTQPGSIDYSKDKTEGGKFENPFDIYVIEKQNKQIDERLKEARSVLEDRTKLLKLKEEELKLSNNIYDRIYYFRCIENKTPTQIAFIIPCDKTTVYRYMQDIERHLIRKGYMQHSLYVRKQRKQN